MVKYVYDVETYKNYLLFVFKDLSTGRISYFDDRHLSTEKGRLAVKRKFFSALDDTLFIGYNNKGFDSVFLDYAYEICCNMREFPGAQAMQRIASDIIEKDIKTWKVRRNERLFQYHTNQLDVMTHCGVVNMGLKELGIRTGYPILEALPYDPNLALTEGQKNHIFKYCKNDVNVTEHIYNGIAKSHVSGKYDLVEHIFGGRITSFRETNARLVGTLLNPTELRFQRRNINYTVPEKIKDFIVFEDEGLNKILNYMISLDIGRTIPADDIDSSMFTTHSYGINLDFGLGGLHACKKQQMYLGLIDVDVASMYPNIIKVYDLFPDFVPEDKKQLYYDLITERVSIKQSNPGKANAYKLVLNTTYGILNDAYSPLYAPNSAYSVTFTGQLVLAKLIEMFSLAGYEVMTANTDGITIVDNGDDVSWRECIKEWEDATGLVMEDVRLTKTVMRDVNNYVWITDNGKLKRKGVFDTSPSKKTASHAKVSVDAVVNWIATGEAVDSYITKRYRDKTDRQEWLMYHKFGKKSYEFTRLVDSITGEHENFDHVIRYLMVDNSTKDVVAYTNLKTRVRGEYVKTTKTGKQSIVKYDDAYSETKPKSYWTDGEFYQARGEKRLADATGVLPVWDISEDFSWNNIHVQRYIDIAKELQYTLPQESVAERRTRVESFVTEKSMVPLIADMCGANLMSTQGYVYNENLQDFSVVVTEFGSEFHRYMFMNFGQDCVRFDWTDKDGSRKLSFVLRGVTKKAFTPRKNDTLWYYSKSEKSLAPLFLHEDYFELLGTKFIDAKNIDFDKFLITKEGQISFQ